MKNIAQRFGKLALSCTFAFSLVSNICAQPVPPESTNNNPPPTEEQRAAAWQAYLARLSNNLASVSEWIHDGVTNSDGEPVFSMQDFMESQTMAFSESDTFSWQQSALDEARTWATAVGIPIRIEGEDGTAARLVGREGNVPIYLVPFDIGSAVTINTTNVWPGGSTGFNLTGTNTTIAQWDEASPRLSHSEFGSRVSVLDGTTNLSDHSTAVAGMLAAAGANTIYSNGVPIGQAAKGMAYEAHVQARSWDLDVSEMTGAVGTNHTRLSNHSYGVNAGWYNAAGAWYWFGNSEISMNRDPKFGNYTTNASNYDIIAQNAPTYLQVWAAGNDRLQGPPVQPTNHYEFTLQNQLILTNRVHPPDGDEGGYDTISQQASAKNILTVGAVNPLPNGYSGATNLILASFSSCGPTDDGRIKPDVVGDGVNNILTTSGSDYSYAIGNGTSYASPSIAGSIGLLTEFYRQLHTNSAEPLSSTIKGLVIHTADSGTTNNGPSYSLGWGLMNTRTAATLISHDATNGLKNHIKEVLLPNGQFIEFPVIATGTNALKVTICWTDPAGSPNAMTNLNNPTPKLVNDLDLRVISPSGATNFPWILSPDLTNRTAAARSAVATTGNDSRNNVEQIYIANPVTNGTYIVSVTHKGALSGNSQWVSILTSGNVPQQPPALALNQVIQVATNAMAVGWPAVVGQQYQLKTIIDLSTNGNDWVNLGSIISARRTNVAIQVTTTNRQFFRLLQTP